MLLDKVMKEKNELIDSNYYLKCYINDLKTFKYDPKKPQHKQLIKIKHKAFFLKMAELQCNFRSQTYRVSIIKIETLSGKK